MKKVTKQHFSFFFRWFLHYNANLVWLQVRMPRIPEQPDEHIARALDSRRMKAQLKIFDIAGGYGHVCSSCGRCCLAKVERYTGFDQFIHKGTGKPLRHFDSTILHLPWMIKNGIRNTMTRLLNHKGSYKESCRYLGESGCTLPLEKRPLLCTSWFCPKYIFAMHPASLDALSEQLVEIRSIHREIAKTVPPRKKHKTPMSHRLP